MNFWEIIILFFSFQALVLAFLFLIRRTGDKLANRILAVFLLLFAYNLFYNVLYWSRFNNTLLVLLNYSYPIPISMYGALFFLYIRRVTTRAGINWKDSLHLIPFLLIVYQYGQFYTLPLEIKIHAVNTNTAQNYLNYLTPWGLLPFLVILLFVYGLYTYFKFIHHYKKDPELTIWLRAISLSFISFTLSHIVYRVLVYTSIISLEFDYFITIFMIFLISMVCYFAFAFTSVFNGKPLKKIIPFVKYEKTGLSKEFSLEMKIKLENLMAQEKPFLNPDIRLDTIAELLDVSRHHASQIINEHFSVNFFDFINQYRIKEAERLLSSEKKPLSITDIAYLSGFNNRISFYKAFKKMVGTTPTAYREHTLVT